MQKVILIKYGELTTKKDNRSFFIKTLVKNIKDKLEGINFSIEYDYYRMFIKTDQIEEALERLKCVFGIYEIIVANRFKERSLDSICVNVYDAICDKEFKTFKIETNRSDKSFESTSLEINKRVGAYILKNIDNVSVDIKNPDLLVNVEIRTDYTYIYYDKIKGLCGYPVSSLGKGLLMLSGGIDSPVAAYLTMKKGVNLSYIYFESIPHTSLEARKKVIELANIIYKYGCRTKLYIVNFTKIQETIYKEGNPEYIITIMRRMMYRISERLAKKIHANAIFNGESIGQVASQTLTSMNAVNNVTNFPVIRPLASFDKLEIIDISKRIGTYDTSILPYEDCCTIFVPKHPVINPNIEECERIEKLFDYEKMIEEAMEDMIVVDIPEVEKETLEEYL